jgi:mycofactocin system glycosyltransferase
VSAPGDGSLRDRYEQAHSPLDLGAAEARVAPRTAVAYVPTAALVVRLAAVEAVDGFDPSLRFGEDVDLVWRLVAAGGAIRYEPAVQVIHRPRTTWRAWFRQRRGYGTAAAPLARRHPGQVPPVAVSGWSAAAWLAAAGGHPLVGLAVAGVSAALLPRKLASTVPDPWAESLRLAGRGHLHAGRWLARAVTRTWWPLALVAALASRRARLAVGAAMLVPLIDWTPDVGLGRVEYLLARLADDVAYGTGVWEGCLRERSVAALVPDLRSWPGKRGSGALEG